MSFPLADWIHRHAHVPHNLAKSGVIGSLETLPEALEHPMPPDFEAFRTEIAELHGVSRERVFVTHGATEANGLALLYLARTIASREGRTPRLHVPPLEYPPLGDAGEAVGFVRSPGVDTADVWVRSSPQNPSGTLVAEEEIHVLAEGGRSVLVDQTFREFTDAPPISRHGWERVWLTGSFTKVYGADDLRLGFAIPPESERAAFDRVHALMLDEIPPASVAGGRAILAHRAEILEESRALFRTNERYLRARIPEIPPLAAPVCFDRGPSGFDGDAFAHRLLSHGVLVCPGSYFGDREGVRLTLTRRSFPADLDAYLRYRDFDGGAGARPSPGSDPTR